MIYCYSAIKISGTPHPPTPWLACLMLLGGLLGTEGVFGKAVYVNGDSPNPNAAKDGLSWSTAFADVQSGISAAAAGDEVWVAAGNYSYSGGVWTERSVSLYGGFSGTETNRVQRDWSKHVTQISALGGAVVKAGGAKTDQIQVDGFTLTGGDIGVQGLTDWVIVVNNVIVRNGRGIQYLWASGLVSNNVIAGNGKWSQGTGGGISCENSSPVIVNNRIQENCFGIGAGIYCLSSSPRIAWNLLLGNQASSRGGGIDCEDSSPVISNNRFIANITRSPLTGPALGGAAICCFGNSSPTIINNDLIGNRAFGGPDTTGGGIYCAEGTAPLIVNNTLVRNQAGHGGGIYSISTHELTWHNNIVAFGSSGLEATGPIYLRNNCVYANGTNDLAGTVPSGNDFINNLNIAADPLLLENEMFGDVRIRPDSPCRDAGLVQAVGADWVDIDGQPRTQGGKVDIGADESDGITVRFEPLIVRVSSAGDDNNDGSSWSTAKQTVQAAVDWAGTHGGEVWVRAGTYYETVALPPFTYFYGGFRGTETEREQRSWVANPTVLDGRSRASVITANFLGKFSAIDGFTIRNGNAPNGGGILCQASQIQIVHNVISNNVAGIGGGIACVNDNQVDPENQPIIANNRILWNQTTNGTGGGIVFVNAAALVANNFIADNQSGYTSGQFAGSFAMGGGIYGGNCQLAVINNTLLRNNSILRHDYETGLDLGGGVSLVRGTNTVANNVIAFGASGIRVLPGSAARVFNNCVYGNGSNYVLVADLTGTNGNISLDPEIVELGSNLFLSWNSPCRGAGDLSVVQSDWLI
jgi:hypothetical protein